MAAPEILEIQVFRSEPGDLDIKNAASTDAAGDAEQVAMDRLASYFNDEKRSSRRKPTQARLIGQDDRVIAEFRMTPKGPEKVQRPARK